MLRHKVDLGLMLAVDRSVEIREVVPKFKLPKRVMFRRDGDVSSLVDSVKDVKFVEILAAVGAGKSTRLPLQLARVTGKLVIHTIPFATAARYLYEYLATTDDGERVVYMDDLGSDMPQHGVVIMTTGFFHARMAHDKFVGVSNAILYLDEIHESDAYTAVLRDIAPAMLMFSTVVKATATIDPGAAETVHLPGRRVEREYPKRAVTSWKSDDVGMPWSIDNIDANTLMVIDRADVRVRLAAEYQDSGYDVRVCTADTSYDYFRETVRRLADPNGGVVIVIVDYAYRSSFTLPGLVNIIDSCEVGVPRVEDGRPVFRYRAAYDFEVQQFLGRGARLPGDNAVLWRSEVPALKYMCDLEYLECDAANLLYRLLGFRPPPALATYAYYMGDVPIDISAALLNAHPLSLCPPESMEPWVNGKKPKALCDVQEAYRYEMGKRGRRHVSCHTVLDAGDRPPSPPPPVPSKFRSTSVDREALEEYSSSRASSPVSAIYTLKSEVPDNISLYDPNSEHFSLKKPKRIAKRVLEQRRLEAEALRDAPVVSSADVGVVTQPCELVASDARVPVDSTVLPSGRVPAVESTHDVAPFVDLSSKLSGIANEVDEVAFPADAIGRYIHYHGMDEADSTSQYFMHGVDSIFAYCDGKNAKLLMKELPEVDKLWAMNKLVNAWNESTAVAMGIQRFVIEIQKRPVSEWDHIVDRDSLDGVVRWMHEASTKARLRVRSCYKVIPYFARYKLDYIPAPLGLEQQVMLNVADKFESAAVKKDPDKITNYLRNLNGRLVNIGKIDTERNRFSDIM